MLSNGRIEYNKGKLYMGLDNERIINNSRANNHYWRDDNRFEHFRKATLQELIDKFTNKETIKEDTMKKELTQELIKDLKNLIAPENEEAFNKIMGIKKPIFNKENFITGDKVVVRNGCIYLVIKDCNAGYYGKQVFMLLRCNMNGGFLSCHFYDNELRNLNSSDFDIMKVYRFEDGIIVDSSMNGDLEDYDLVWSR